MLDLQAGQVTERWHRFHPQNKYSSALWNLRLPTDRLFLKIAVFRPLSGSVELRGNALCIKKLRCYVLCYLILNPVTSYKHVPLLCLLADQFHGAKDTDSRTRLLGFKSQSLNLVAVWTCKSYLTSLHFILFIYKIRKTIAALRKGCAWFNTCKVLSTVLGT